MRKKHELRVVHSTYTCEVLGESLACDVQWWLNQGYEVHLIGQHVSGSGEAYWRGFFWSLLEKYPAVMKKNKVADNVMTRENIRSRIKFRKFGDEEMAVVRAAYACVCDPSVSA